MGIECLKCHSENTADSRFCKSCAAPLPPSEHILNSHTKTLETPIKELTRGSTFAGRYEIIEELGKGGMGKVYRVEDKKIREEIALKLIKPEIASEKKTIERFRNELKLARKISHKNICRMYDLNEEESAPFITMEYVSGEDLKSMIRMMGQLSVEKAIGIAKQICEGLAEAHRLGIVHRDLKPRNIMIDKEGNVRIMDFGIARSLKAEGITGDGVMVGTPEYMSPEQVKGEKADQRSDIYSLGIILFEMVTGRIPFEGDTSLIIALKHKTELPPDPRNFNKKIPEELSQVILKCMEKDGEKRFQRVEELFSELSKIEDEISTRERIFPRRKVRVGISRKRFLLPALLSAAIILAIGYLFFGRTLLKAKVEWKNSIAVLPVKDLSPQRDQEALCEGILDDIINKLSSVKKLKVTPFITAIRFKDTPKNPKEIGDELNTRTILELSLKKEENKIRVTARLVDAKQGFVIWNDSYPQELVSIFDVEDKISKSISEALEIELVEKTLAVIKKREPKNPEAFIAYTKGRHFERIYKVFSRQSDFEEAVKNLDKAISIDENYARAFWALGNIYQAYFVDNKKWKDFDSMEKNYRKAYQIDPDLAEANVGLGWAYFYREDWDEAFNYYKKALKLDPANPEINYHVAGFLRDIGLCHKAIELYSRAIDIDPESTSYRALCARCYMYIGEFEKAAALLKEALELEPNNVRLIFFYARQLIMMRKYDEAEKEIAKAEQFDPESSDIQYTRAYLFALRGEKERALSIIEDLDSYLFTHLISSVYSILGMKDEAIENIRKVIDKGFYEVKTYPYSYHFLVKNHFYDKLRNDNRFKEIVRAEERKYKEKLRKYDNL